MDINRPAKSLRATLIAAAAASLALASAALASAALASAALASAALASAAVASSPHRLSGLHDARYCEIIEVKGLPPVATATVWNSIALNRCPAAQWRAFDAGALARELGDTFVVLNGPRHFLMDSVSAETGGVRAFHGLRMTKAATIALRSAADLIQMPYTERTIMRSNTWRWNKGRTVYELVAPGGDTYVMQSYAQISDPTLTLSKLGSLGRRLRLPSGWSYRTRKLERELVLAATGKATVIQDELKDTYQLATTARRGAPVRHTVAITGVTRTVKTPATPGTVEDHGTLTGTPFGSGSIVLVGKLAGGRLNGTFTVHFARGSITGTVSMPFTISGNQISFRGTSRFTGGTGAYREISSGELQTRDTNTLDGQSGRLSVDGVATY